MKLRPLTLTVAIVLSLPVAFAQTNDNGAKQDMKNAGSDTQHAATSAVGVRVCPGASSASRPRAS